jgi:hypothetical protein
VGVTTPVSSHTGPTERTVPRQPGFLRAREDGGPMLTATAPHSLIGNHPLGPTPYNPPSPSPSHSILRPVIILSTFSTSPHCFSARRRREAERSSRRRSGALAVEKQSARRISSGNSPLHATARVSPLFPHASASSSGGGGSVVVEQPSPSFVDPSSLLPSSYWYLSSHALS